MRRHFNYDNVVDVDDIKHYHHGGTDINDNDPELQHFIDHGVDEHDNAGHIDHKQHHEPGEHIDDIIDVAHDDRRTYINHVGAGKLIVNVNDPARFHVYVRGRLHDLVPAADHHGIGHDDHHPLNDITPEFVAFVLALADDTELGNYPDAAGIRANAALANAASALRAARHRD